MFGFLRGFLDGDYAPHGYCLLWRPELIWTHVISDALIAAAYFSIPVALITFVRRRPDIEFGKMFWLFALFILSCGLTHVMGIWNLWNGDYGAEAGIKAITAAASVPTAILLWPLLPKMLAIPSPAQLQIKNDELALALTERNRVLDQLRAEVQQRERAEAALVQSKKIESLGQLTGGIAHDFNNLLQAIAGNLELIGRSPHQAERVARWSANATAAVERGTRLTGQLLTFSRQQRLETQAVDIAAMLADLDELLRNSVGPTVKLDILANDGLCPVASDRTQLELAVLNLAINARDAMSGGGDILIQAKVQTGAGGGQEVAVSVSDNGSGMPPEVVERALEPFFTTKGPGEGTGLGLSMVYGVARQAGGDLRIHSEVGRGTTITMLLPCTSADSTTQTAAVQSADAGAVMRSCDILLVDDDDEVRRTLTDLLTADGHRCVEAGGGEEALEALRQRPFDLLLLDYAMAGMNGAELAARALELRPELKMLFITGFADSDAIDRAVDGRARVLKKPVSSVELNAAIREMLG